MTKKQIDRFFKLAKNASKFSDYPSIHIGAILVYKKNILAIGYNTLKSNPTQKKYNKYRCVNGRNFNVSEHNNSLHAEMMCLNATKRLDIDWSKVSIFVYREHKDGSIGLSMPCRGCYKAIIDKGIKNIYYTTENGYCYNKII